MANILFSGRWKAAAIIVLILLLIGFGLSVYWNRSPDLFNVVKAAQQRVPDGVDPTKVPGSVMTATLAQAVEVLLNKPGGYLSNDITPPSILMDDMANWEFGVVMQVRDLARSLRNDMSRSRSQSAEDKDLAIAEPQFSFPNDKWIFPDTEGEYKKGVKAVDRYLDRLANGDAQFFARADNLKEWLALVSRRLGSLSQRLSASVGEHTFDEGTAGAPSSRHADEGSQQQIYSKTPWLHVDDVFYEARGSAWAIIEFLRAARIDFRDILQDKNAQVYLRQIVRELEYSQRTVWSPVVLNGSGFGFTANYSLILASYLARANAALLELQKLLAEG
ncbi:DUF2333 family protein [Nitrococcus mobilis]|uniref:DUF2333 family protein n=1 Tax=Nitrococcus mobilis Nb-231 TaxID=314278 RepID=A4BQX2_9GAMM|nr:DUF2333 family protein [Nitrococcus mobilis]EAR21972.1 hypothetical protein NB231_06276 [Nitrococcus mobilis Nb-231]